MPVQQTTSSWVQLTGADLRALLASGILGQVDESVTVDTQPDDPPPQQGQPTNRSEVLVGMAVAQCRAAVQAAGRFPLSMLPGAVPNISVQHVLYTAAWQLLTSTPGVPMVVIGEQSVAKKFYDDACKHLDGLRRGENVDAPSDPTGRDYLTAVNTDPAAGKLNLPVCLVRWSDASGTDDDYARGYKTAPWGNTPISLPQDTMTTV